MLFAAGMEVRLLFWAVAEHLTLIAFSKTFIDPPVAAQQTLLATSFHWGIHAWAIYGATALAIAYFTFRRDALMKRASFQTWLNWLADTVVMAVDGSLLCFEARAGKWMISVSNVYATRGAENSYETTQERTALTE